MGTSLYVHICAREASALPKGLCWASGVEVEFSQAELGPESSQKQQPGAGRTHHPGLVEREVLEVVGLHGWGGASCTGGDRRPTTVHWPNGLGISMGRNVG